MKRQPQTFIKGAYKALLTGNAISETDPRAWATAYLNILRAHSRSQVYPCRRDSSVSQVHWRY